MKSIPRAKLKIQRMKIHVGENFSELFLLFILGIGGQPLPCSLILDPCSSLSPLCLLPQMGLFLSPSLPPKWVSLSICIKLISLPSGFSLYLPDEPWNMQRWVSLSLEHSVCIYRIQNWVQKSGNLSNFSTLLSSSLINNAIFTLFPFPSSFHFFFHPFDWLINNFDSWKTW